VFENNQPEGKMGHIRKIFSTRYACPAIFFLFAAPCFAVVSPSASLQISPTNGGTTMTVSAGTSPTISLVVNTNSASASGVQLHLDVSTTTSGILTYGATPITLLNTPFTSADLQKPIVAGTAVQGGTSTFLFHSGSDYAAFNNTIANYQFATSGLPAGNYTITPVFEEFTNSTTDDTTTFGSPGSFTLTVTTPEPGLGLGFTIFAALLGLRRGKSI
jgi:hypothetical protein